MLCYLKCLRVENILSKYILANSLVVEQFLWIDPSVFQRMSRNAIQMKRHVYVVEYELYVLSFRQSSTVADQLKYTFLEHIKILLDILIDIF